MSAKTIWDKHGNRIGEDVISTDRDGLTHITHYDNHGNRIGRSYETRDHRGEVYMIHEDARGNRLARSTVDRDWWGDYYTKIECTRRGREQAETERREAAKARSAEQKPDDDGSSPVVDLLYGIVMVGVKIFVGLLGYSFVMMVSMPLVIEILMISLNNTGNASLGWFGVLSVIPIAYFPYLGILLYRRWKKKITWKDFFFFVLRWAIIGPFAYRKLVRQMQAEKLPRPGALPILKKDQVFCRNCGCISGSQDRFCKKCGAELRREDCIHDVDIPIPGEKS